jgi:hypothetical protein
MLGGAADGERKRSAAMVRRRSIPIARRQFQGDGAAKSLIS